MHSPLRRQGGLLREAPVGRQHRLPTGVLCRRQYVIGVRVVVTAQILERVVDENELWHGGACDIINSMTPDSGNGRHGPARLSVLLLLALITSGRAVAGVSAYLPLSLAPEVEARIERMLALAGVPVMTRPIRVATVVGRAIERLRSQQEPVPAGAARSRALSFAGRRHGRGGRGGGDAGQQVDPTRPARGTDGQRLGSIRERDCALWRAFAAERRGGGKFRSGHPHRHDGECGLGPWRSSMSAIAITGGRRFAWAACWSVPKRRPCPRSRCLTLSP